MWARLDIERFCLQSTPGPKFHAHVRSRGPIDVNKRLGDLTLQDYESYVQFWCNPENLKSGRAVINYVHAFSRMVKRLKVPRPDEFDDVFKMKIMQTPKIVRYNPDQIRRQFGILPIFDQILVS